MARTVAILQPSYMPWLGYLDQLDAADIFVFYDDVQYDKGGWRNRNRIKTARGVTWLTVPVRLPDRDGGRLPAIDDVQVSGAHWHRKHLETFLQAYARAPAVDLVATRMATIFERGDRGIADLAIATVEMLADGLGITTPTVRSSALAAGGARTDRLVAICRELGATRYLSGAAARAYLEPRAFADAGIELLMQDYEHPTYRQLHGDFVPYLSALDLVANEPERGLDIIRSGRRFTEWEDGPSG